MNVRADLHNHLATTSSIERLVEPALRQVKQRLSTPSAYGIMGLINFEDARYEVFVSETQRRLEKRDFGNATFYPEYNALIINGQEVPTQHGHILVLGLSHGDRISSGLPIADTIYLAKKAGGIVIADHPFCKEGIFARLLKEEGGARKVESLIGSLNGIEVHNGEAALYIPRLTPRDANAQALAHYQTISRQAKRNLGMIASSDGHSIREIGTSYTNLDMPEISQLSSSEDLTFALREAIHATAERMDFHAEDSKLGALEHLLKLGLIVLGRKLNLTDA
jgi:hypothetical protein